MSWLWRTLDQILAEQKEIMAAIDTLNANIAALQAEWTKFLADLTTVLAGTGPAEAQVQAAADLVAQQTAAIAGEDTTIG